MRALGKPHRIKRRECLCYSIQKYRACARDVRLLAHRDHALILCRHAHNVAERCIHRTRNLAECSVVRTRQPLVDVDIVLLFTMVFEVHIDIELPTRDTRADPIAQIVLPRTERTRHMRRNLQKALIHRLDLDRHAVVCGLCRTRAIARHASARRTHSVPCHSPVKTGSAGPVIKMCPSARHST